MENTASANSDSPVPLEANDADRSPAVSIIIPAFDASAYVKEALDSVFAQIFSNYEVIVINDGSHDTSQLEQILTPYRDHLIYIKQENRGAAAARNTGLRKAKAGFVAFLDADDCWQPDYLSRQMDFIKRSGADLVYANALLVGNSPLAGRTYMQTDPSRGEVTPESLLAYRCNVITSGVLARKARILEVGLFDETIKRAHDFELWVRLAKHGAKISYQREVLLQHRVLNSGLSGGTKERLAREINILDFINQRGNLTPREDAALHRTLKNARANLALENGKEKLRQKDFAGALHFFNEAKRFRRNWKIVLVGLSLRLAPQLFWRIFRTRFTVSS